MQSSEELTGATLATFANLSTDSLCLVWVILVIGTSPYKWDIQTVMHLRLCVEA